MDLAVRAFIRVPHRVVTFVPRDAKHLAGGGVDHRRVEWVVPGGGAELGVVGVLFGTGQEAEAISRLVPPRHECGFERPGLFKRQVAPAPPVPGPGQLRLGRQPTPARACAASPGAGRTRSSPSGADLAGTFWSVGLNL